MKAKEQMQEKITLREGDENWAKVITEKVINRHKEKQKKKYWFTSISLAAAAILAIAVAPQLMVTQQQPEAIDQISYLELSYDASMADDDLDELAGL